MTARLRRRTALIAFARAFAPGTPGLGRRIRALPRMFMATLRGQYDGGFRMFLMAVASIYIVSPIDALPELFLGVFGLVDDAFVASWLVGTLMAETERFLEWEKLQGRGPYVVPGQVVR
jgi:uncharacterized membrane protein YkvA (DUF1232 family)